MPWQASYDIQANFAAYTSSSGDGWVFHTWLDADGYLVLRGDGASPRWDGTEHGASATLLTPAAGPDPQTWFCSNSGSTLIADLVDTRVSLASLAKLGTCAGGVAVDGEVTICNASGFTDECWFTRSGTLDGVTLTQARWASNQGTSAKDVGVAYPDGMMVRFSRLDHFEATGALSNGFVITPDGTIYCAGASSSHSTDVDGRELNTLRAFTKLGTCTAAGEETLSGCIGSK